MTIAGTTNRVSYAGDGSTTVFSFGHACFASTDLVVVVVTNATGAESVKTITTHYTVSVAADNSSATVTMLTAPTAAETLLIYRAVPVLQGLDLVENGSLQAEALEDALDKIVLAEQRTREIADRAFGLPEGRTAAFSAKLPAGALTPSTCIIINSAGNGIALGPSTADISAAATAVDDAEAAAAAAAASASAAATSATNAASSATAASNSSTAAAASASAASSSASAAAASASNASTSATNAATSATNASNSAALADADRVDASEHVTTASRWAKHTGSTVVDADTGADSLEYSAKEYAQGTTAAVGGSAKNWAQKTDAAVTGTSYSAKEWATGTQTRGAASGGSSKDWATYTGGTVDNSGYSAKYHADAASASSTSASTSASNASTSAASAASSATSAASSATSAASSAAAAAASADSAFFQDTIFVVAGDSPVTITDSSRGKLYSVDASGGAVTINLPQISGLTLSDPWAIAIKKTDSGSNSVTINRAGTDTIDGSASKALTTQNTAAILTPDAGPSPDIWTSLDIGVADDSITLAKLAHGTQGGIPYYAASGAPTELAAGTNKALLQTGGPGANPSWTLTLDVTSVTADTLTQDTVTATAGAINVTGQAAQDLLHYNSGWKSLPKGDEGDALFVRSGILEWAPPGADIQEFTTAGSHTWTKPVGKTLALIYLVGPGGAGGSGRKGAAGTGRSGGGGGSGARPFLAIVPVSSLDATETVTIPTVRTGGAAVTANDTDGNPGQAQVDLTFDHYFSRSGAPGGGGTSSAGTAGAGATGFLELMGVGAGTAPNGGAGDDAAAGAAGATVSNARQPPGGGGGGGVSSGDVASAGGAGGAQSFNGTIAFPATAAGGAAGANGTNGSVALREMTAGSGGGGGGGSNTGNGGNGGNGIAPGTGGGGGGGATNGVGNSGKGGDGGPGYALIVCW